MSAPPPTPGWYPDPMGTGQRYWDGNQWGPAEPSPAPPAAGNLPAHKPGNIGSIIKALFILGVVVYFGVTMCGGEKRNTTSTNRSSGQTTSTSSHPPTNAWMPGDDTYSMGGVDGRDWGVWTATVPSGGRCSWSILSVTRYRGTEILDGGSGEPGEQVRVDIEPDGDVGTFDGMIGDHRIMFRTYGCGPWTTR